MRRGFKSEANAIAREVRAELSLSRTSPLDMRKLADHLAIPLIPLSSFKRLVPNAVGYFSSHGEDQFSALTVIEGHRRVIVYNDSHVEGRQSNDIAHELAHGLLLHEPTPAFNELGLRNLDADLEEEANFLAGALLIPEEAALMIVQRGWQPDQAARHFGVTPALIGYRLNVTAAQKRVGRVRARSGRPGR